MHYFWSGEQCVALSQRVKGLGMHRLNFHQLVSCFGTKSWMCEDSVLVIIQLYSESRANIFKKSNLNSILWKILDNHLNRVHRWINWAKTTAPQWKKLLLPPTSPKCCWFSYREPIFREVPLTSEYDILSLSQFCSPAYHGFFVSNKVVTAWLC